MTEHSVIDILKMDIEGSEFDVMEQILTSGADIRQICLETHDYLYTDGSGREKLVHLIEVLNTHRYYAASVPWNVNEITFLKVDS